MSEEQWFGVGIRLIGVWVWLLAAEYLLAFAALGIGLTRPRFESEPEYHIFLGATYLILGLLIVKGADIISGLAYQRTDVVGHTREG